MVKKLAEQAALQARGGAASAALEAAGWSESASTRGGSSSAQWTSRSSAAPSTSRRERDHPDSRKSQMGGRGAVAEAPRRPPPPARPMPKTAAQDLSLDGTFAVQDCIIATYVQISTEFLVGCIAVVAHKFVDAPARSWLRLIRLR